MDEDSLTCTALRGDMSFCGRKSVPLAPFPICRVHLMRAHEFVQGFLRDVMERTDADADAAYEGMIRSRKIGLDAQSVVYYILEPDGMVKIGFTNNLHSRLIALRVSHDAVLATEPGGRKLERERHVQFKHLRLGRWEKFRPAQELQDHIAALIEQHGAPSITTWPKVMDK